MEALLRQSKSMCPFLHKTSPATLRSLSTTTAAATRPEVSPGGGSMSNLQVLARRCPIMGKALAVQTARNGNNALAGAFGGVRAYHTRVNRARLHTTASKEAQAVDIETLRGQKGMYIMRKRMRQSDMLTLRRPRSIPSCTSQVCGQQAFPRRRLVCAQGLEIRLRRLLPE